MEAPAATSIARSTAFFGRHSKDLGAGLLAGLSVTLFLTLVLILVHLVELLDIELGEVIAKFERLHWVAELAEIL